MMANFSCRQDIPNNNMTLQPNKAQQIAKKIADEYAKELETPKEIRVRIDDIEFRSTSKYRGEIIQWLPNHYYGKLGEYLEGGDWKDDGHCVVTNGGSIDKACFENEQYCIVIAHIVYSPREECCELTTVGPRVLNLKQEERDTFFEVYELVDKKLTNQRQDHDREY
jgi:hypothetical protein